MSESFFAAVKVVTPMMLLIILGWFTRIKGMITRPAMKEVDRILFKIFMPTLLFKNIYDMDFSQGLAVKEMIFAGICITLLFFFSIVISKFLTDDGNKSASLAEEIIFCSALRCRRLCTVKAISEQSLC